jgi:hypothetical protein
LIAFTLIAALGPVPQILQGGTDEPRRYLAIAPGTASQYGAPIQVQATQPGS